MGLFQRLFGATRDAIALPDFDAENKAVEVSVSMLRECMDLGFAGPGPNRGRLVKPFARGYIFGFSDACTQRLGVLEELESLALITLVHVRIFGHKIGSSLVGDALRDERNAEFSRGRTPGARDLFRWLEDRSYAPLVLTRFLQADDATSCPMVPTGVVPTESGIEQSDVLTRHTPSGRNTAQVRKNTLMEAAPRETATITRLRTGLKTMKPIEH